MHWSDSFISSACVCWLKLSSACGIERERDRERDSIWLHSSSALSLLHIIPAAATCVFVERFSSSHFFALHPVVEMTFVNKSVEQEKSWEMWSKTLEREWDTSIYTHTLVFCFPFRHVFGLGRAICSRLSLRWMDGSKWSLRLLYVYISTYRSYSKHPLNL